MKKITFILTISFLNIVSSFGQYVINESILGKSQCVVINEFIEDDYNIPLDNVYKIYKTKINFKGYIDNIIYAFFNDEILYMISYEPRVDQFSDNTYLTRKLYLYRLDGHKWEIASPILMEHSIFRKNNIKITESYHSEEHHEGENKYYLKKKDNGDIEMKLLTNTRNRGIIKCTSTFIILRRNGDGTYRIIKKEEEW